MPYFLQREQDAAIGEVKNLFIAAMTQQNENVVLSKVEMSS
jgi:hypothetical protein